MTLKYPIAALLILLCIPKLTWSQCNPTPQTSISGNRCVGSELLINSNRLPESVIWTNAGSVVASQTVALSSQAVTVAGGNGAGNNANQLYNPDRLYVDAAGVMYIPDLTNNRIQKWLPGATSGITVAGGNGSGNAANQFNRPTSVFVDHQGNIFVTDQANKRVQKWAPGATAGVTVAGLNNELSYPTDVFIDDNGNLYVSDQYNNVVLKYAAGSTTGVVVAGTYTASASLTDLRSPTGIFVDGAGNLYVCDTDNWRVQKWAPGATSGVTIAFTYIPLDVSVDCSGNVFVADWGNNRIEKIAPGRPGVTIAGGNGPGTGANQLSNPAGVFIVGNNSLYVADFGNNRVQRFSNSIDARFTPTAPGNYSVTVNYPCCPSYTESFEIYAEQHPQVSITATATSICAGDQVTFSAQNTNNILEPAYQWVLNGVPVGSNTVDYLSTTLHNNDNVQCILTSNRVCTLPGSDTSNVIQMNVNDPVPLDLGKDIIICPGADTILKASSNYVSYRWQDNSTQPELTVNAAGKYYLTVTDACNRTFSDTVNVTLFKVCPPKGVYVPNAFSPDNNGVNDVFRPVIAGTIKSYRFAVFNRYGQMVFNTTDPDKGWNGTINGNLPNAGVYVWLCQYELEGQKATTKKGTVVLLK